MWVGGGGPLALAFLPHLNPWHRKDEAEFPGLPPGLDRPVPVAAALAPSPRSCCHWDKAQG
jgi:hypothetical protein